MSEYPDPAASQTPGSAEQISVKAKRRSFRPKTQKRPTPELELFQRESDPACHAVRIRLTQLGLDYIARNARIGDALKNQQLVQVGGKAELPFLIDHRSGVHLYGANAILAYLEKEHGQTAKSPLLKVARQINRQVRVSADEITWAVRMPVDQILRMRGEAGEAWHLLERSMKTLRNAWNKRKTEQPDAPPRPSDHSGKQEDQPAA